MVGPYKVTGFLDHFFRGLILRYSTGRGKELHRPCLRVVNLPYVGVHLRLPLPVPPAYTDRVLSSSPLSWNNSLGWGVSRENPRVGVGPYRWWTRKGRGWNGHPRVHPVHPHDDRVDV